MWKKIRPWVIGIASATGLVLAPIILVAQTSRVSPVTTITCSAGDFINQLTGAGTFSCGTPAGTGINQLTGDVTAGPGTGSQAATIANNAVTDAKLAQGAANTLKGNPTGSTANETDVSVPSCTDTGGNHLNWTSGTGFSCGTSGTGGITQLTGDVTAGPGSGSQATTIANNAVTNAKSAQMAANTVKANTTNSTADPADASMPSCADTGGNHLNYTSGTGFSCGTSLGSAAGYLNQVMSGTPTASGTGLTTNTNIGTATVTDGLTGLTICGATNSGQLEGRTKTAPSPTYNIDAIIRTDVFSAVSGFGPIFGWYDGTKYQVFMFARNSSGVVVTYVLRYATSGSGASAAAIDATLSQASQEPATVRLRDDGTNVYWQLAPAGDYSNAQTIYSVAKASGYLANYNTLVFGINANNGGVCGTMISYTER